MKIKKGKNKNTGGDAAGGVGGGGNPDPAGEHADPPHEDGNESDDYLTKKIKAEAADLNTETALAKEDWSADTSPGGR